MKARVLGIGSWWSADFENFGRVVSEPNLRVLADYRPPIYAAYSGDHRVPVARDGWVVAEPPKDLLRQIIDSIVAAAR